MKYLFLLSLTISTPSWAFFINSSSSSSATATVINNDFNQSLSDLVISKLAACFVNNEVTCPITISKKNAILVKDYIQLSTTFKVKTTTDGLSVFLGDAFACENNLKDELNLPKIETMVNKQEKKIEFLSRQNYADLCISKVETSIDLTRMFKDPVKHKTYSEIHSVLNRLEDSSTVIANRSRSEFRITVFVKNFFTEGESDKLGLLPKSMRVKLPSGLAPLRTTTAKTASSN